jgi:hypothetical protein
MSLNKFCSHAQMTEFISRLDHASVLVCPKALDVALTKISEACRQESTTDTSYSDKSKNVQVSDDEYDSI